MDVCQKCGDKGYLKDLIYCLQCKVSAEHRYCLDILPKSRSEKVDWTCEECTPKDAKLSPVSFRKSERITQAAEVRLSRKQMLKQTSFLKNKSQAHLGNLAEVQQSRHDCLLSNDELKSLLCSDKNLGNQELRKQKRRLLLADGENSDEDSKPMKAEAPLLVPTVYDGSLNTSCYLLPLESNKNFHSQPIIYPIWRGCFNISNVKGQTFVGLVAHLTSRSCSKVLDAATALPQLLTVEIMPKCNVWPQRFQISPPTDDIVDLNFFPEYESDEKIFDGLLDDMIEHNLALKAVIKDVELLAFSSRELPPDHWRNITCGVCFKQVDILSKIGTQECDLARTRSSWSQLSAFAEVIAICEALEVLFFTQKL